MSRVRVPLVAPSLPLARARRPFRQDGAAHPQGKHPCNCHSTAVPRSSPAARRASASPWPRPSPRPAAMSRLVARGAEALARGEAEIREAAPTARVVAIACDIRTAEGCEQAYTGAVRALGQVDILVNNAGTSPARPVPRGHRRALAGRPRPQAVRRDPPVPAGLAGHEGAQMGPHHQRAQHRRQGARGHHRADLGVARRRHGADQGAGERRRARTTCWSMPCWSASSRATSGCSRHAAEKRNISWEDWKAEHGQARSPSGASARRRNSPTMALLPRLRTGSYVTGTAINVDGGASPVV